MSLTERRRGRRRERLFVAACACAVFAPLALLAWLLGDVLVDAVVRLDLDFVTGFPSRQVG